MAYPQTNVWGSRAMLEDADKVCSFCKAVRIDGEWDRMKSKNDRAYELSQASSTKSIGDYREILGEVPGGEGPGRAGARTVKESDDTDDADDLDIDW